MRSYDLAVGVGPVSSRPLSDKGILFVLGPTAAHRCGDWDTIIVTSPKAERNVKKAFTGKDVRLMPIPLLELDAGRRRLMDRIATGLCASPVPVDFDCIQMALWSWPKSRMPFCVMEFNSLCRHGAFGYYCGLDDGYDVQVRRHLALGSPVVCDCDPEVLGGLESHCVTTVRELPLKQEAVEDMVKIDDYEQQIENIVRSM